MLGRSPSSRRQRDRSSRRRAGRSLPWSPCRGACSPCGTNGRRATRWRRRARAVRNTSSTAPAWDASLSGTERWSQPHHIPTRREEPDTIGRERPLRPSGRSMERGDADSTTGRRRRRCDLRLAVTSSITRRQESSVRLTYRCPAVASPRARPTRSDKSPCRCSEAIIQSKAHTVVRQGQHERETRRTRPTRPTRSAWSQRCYRTARAGRSGGPGRGRGDGGVNAPSS